ncbi:MAG: histidine phosphatase family protein [Gammaproteobacteria bacterium]|nr:histidine phosphatase family protein [Gammaproteobacteria bacterium]
MTTKIDVIRHGEPEGGRRYRGYGVNDPLTEKGWQQMWASMPEQPPWDLIISSPLARCLDFAQALAEKAGIDCIVEDNLKEIGFGVWEGLTPDEILAKDSEALNHFYNDPVNNRPEGAEPLHEFSDRVWLAYQSIAATHSNKHILIVGHAGIARAVVANVLKMSLDDVYSRLSVEYASIISTVIKEGAPPKLVIKA